MTLGWRQRVGLMCVALGLLCEGAAGADYRFDQTISESVLRAYLARSVTAMDLLTGRGDLPDNIRMLRSVGAKFAGRTIYLWGAEETLGTRLAAARRAAQQVHAADPEIVLQACVFEIVSRHVEQVEIPEWAFIALGMPYERRTFRFDDMRYADGQLLDTWGKDTAVPDLSRPETQLWFHFLARSYIDAGAEAIHFGQIELMNRNDPQSEFTARMLARVREYARGHARRHLVLCDAHLPSGGIVRNGELLFDFHSFPLRLTETPGRPQEAKLEVGHGDSFFGRSKGGRTPSGWSCAHLPYLLEFDNWGASDHPGKPNPPGTTSIFVWGYDEIGWFAHQPEVERNEILRRTDAWVRGHDPDGYVQMPMSRCLATPINGVWWYTANTRSAASPEGGNQEETIRAIWQGSEPATRATATRP